MFFRLNFSLQQKSVFKSFSKKKLHPVATVCTVAKSLLLPEAEGQRLEALDGSRERYEILDAPHGPHPGLDPGLYAGKDAGQRGEGAGPGQLSQRRRAVEGLGEDSELAGPAVDALLLRLVGGARALGRLLGHADAPLDLLLLGAVELDEAGEPSGTYA